MIDYPRLLRAFGIVMLFCLGVASISLIVISMLFYAPWMLPFIPIGLLTFLVYKTIGDLKK